MFELKDNKKMDKKIKTCLNLSRYYILAATGSDIDKADKKHSIDHAQLSVLSYVTYMCLFTGYTVYT